jgi:hypothetical protein
VSEIASAQIVAFFLFDIAETIDLKAVPAQIKGPAQPARLLPKPATPAYVQYDNPPLSFDGELVGMPEVDGFRVRLRAFDYGVISVALHRPFVGSWDELSVLAQSLSESPELEARAVEICQTVAGRLSPVFTGYRDASLTEDYIVYAVNAFDEPVSADDLLARHGNDIAAILRGDLRPLSAQERASVLSHRLSYLADDLVVPAWNAAFVYDTPAGVLATLEILEFANSQLLEFRYYDQLLDNELGSIYASLQKPRWYDQWLGSRYAKAARRVHALYIDVSELTDRTENALKFIGDLYAVRLFGIVAGRLGLETWKADVQSKLKTLDDIYRFAVERGSIARGEFLEATVVLILMLELALILLRITK